MVHLENICLLLVAEIFNNIFLRNIIFDKSIYLMATVSSITSFMSVSTGKKDCGSCGDRFPETQRRIRSGTFLRRLWEQSKRSIKSFFCFQKLDVRDTVWQRDCFSVIRLLHKVPYTRNWKIFSLHFTNVYYFSKMTIKCSFIMFSLIRQSQQLLNAVIKIKISLKLCISLSQIHPQTPS